MVIARLTRPTLYDNTTKNLALRLRDLPVSCDSAAPVPADRLPLCEQSEVPPGRMLRVHPEGRDAILVCNVAGKFHAVDDECTHAIASLSEGRLQGNIVTCPFHGGSFDVCSGEAKSLPCRLPLRTWPLAIADGKVYLLIKR